MNPSLPSESGEQQQSYGNSDRDGETGGKGKKKKKRWSIGRRAKSKLEQRPKGLDSK